MREYYTTDKNEQVVLVTDGVQRKVTFAIIDGQEMVYIHPTDEEKLNGVTVYSKPKSSTAIG
jgi:hypothetical protein